MKAPVGRKQRLHARLMVDYAAKIASCSDKELQLLAGDSEWRPRLQENLATVLRALNKSESLRARRSLGIQADRIRRALNNPGILA